MVILRPHSFLYKAQNNCTYKQLRINKHLFFNFGMSQIFLVIQSSTPYEKFCLWALMIAIDVSITICQFHSFGKKSIWTPFEWALQFYGHF